jgi:hypothetical protein
MGQLTSHLPVPVLLYLLAVVIPIGFQIGPLAMNLLRLLLIVMILPLLIRLFMGRYGKVLITDVLFMAHIVWATIALAVINPDRVVEQMGSIGLEFLGGYLMGRAYIRTPEAFAGLCRALMIIVCCSAPFALYETLKGHSLLIEAIRSIPGIRTSNYNYMEPRFGLRRVQFGFVHPIHYGLFCSVALSLTYVALRGLMSGFWRVLASGVILLCGFLALSSGAFLAILLQIGLITWSVVFARVRSRWWLLLGLFALTYVVIDILSNRTPIMVFMSYATFSAHTAYWRGIIFDWGMMSVWAHPVFGIGMNDWVRPWFMYSGSMDNFWLVMAVRYGFPGFFLLAIGYAIAIWRIGRRDFSRDAVLTQFRRAWIFTFLGLTFTLTTVHVWTNIYSFVFFMFGTGIWLITADNSGREPAAAPPGSAGTGPDKPLEGGPRFSRFPRSRTRNDLR